MSHKTYLKQEPNQRERAREDQVVNNAGGYVFQTGWKQSLERFLILGTEGGTYYVNEREMTRNNLNKISSIMNSENGCEAVKLVEEISASGRAYKNDPALAALAIASTSKIGKVRMEAFKTLPNVARIPTHLFNFVDYHESFGGGWGRGMRKAISSWYNDKPADKLNFHMAKYQQRNGWSHGDLLRLAHPIPTSEMHSGLYRWAVGKEGEVFGTVEGLEAAKLAQTEQEIVDVINTYKLPFECVPTQWMKSILVWNALLPNLGYTAVLRSLVRMAKIGFIQPGKFGTINRVVDIIANEEKLKKSKVHPIQILSALRMYATGGGYQYREMTRASGEGSWEVAHQITAALDHAFYEAFENVEPTGKNFYIAVDCSGSMSSPVLGLQGISARDAAAVIAMVVAKREKNSVIKGFSNASGWNDSAAAVLPISPNDSLDKVSRLMDHFPWGATDCSLPFIDAKNSNLDIDMFVVITDNETYHGRVHPFEALKTYRKVSGKEQARSIVLATTATDFTISDPKDPYSMDIAGFDAAIPRLIAEFAEGKI